MIKVQVINKGHQQLPAYATLQSAGMDLRANLEASVVLHPMERKLIKTGFSSLCRKDLRRKCDPGVDWH